jgi:Glycosyl transferase family 2
VPTFSVVIAAYQAADTVGAAVASALDQTVTPLEVIVIDDGSTDDIAAALAPYGREITVISKENGGKSSALNVGLAKARGEFAALLDADDAYEPRRIEALGALAAERPDLDLLMTDAHLELDGRIVGRFCSETPFATRAQRTAILDRCFVVCPSFRISRLEQVGGFDESIRMAEDWDCWIRLIMHGVLVGLVDAPLYRYRLRHEGVDGPRADSLRSRVQVLEKTARASALTAQERVVLSRTLAESRQRAMLAEAEAALRSRDRSARRRSLAVAVGRGFGVRTRAKAALAVLAPRAAGRRLGAMEATTGWSRLQRGYPRG